MGPNAPYAFAIDPASRLAYARMWGEVDGANMLALISAVHDDPAWQPGFDAVWDCSTVSAHIVLPDDVPPIVANEVASGDGRDVLIESPYVGESAFSNMLAAFCRRHGKDMTVYSTCTAGLSALGYDALPEALAGIQVPV